MLEGEFWAQPTPQKGPHRANQTLAQLPPEKGSHLAYTRRRHVLKFTRQSFPTHVWYVTATDVVAHYITGTMLPYDSDDTSNATCHVAADPAPSHVCSTLKV